MLLRWGPGRSTLVVGGGFETWAWSLWRTLGLASRLSLPTTLPYGVGDSGETRLALVGARRIALILLCKFQVSTALGCLGRRILQSRQAVPV